MERNEELKLTTLKTALKNSILANYDRVVFLPEISMVWFSKTLRNFKGLFIVEGFEQQIFEVTFNSAKNEAYVDEYKKVNNNVVVM